MSAIVNDRDVLLQAASPRLDVVASLVYGSLTRDSFVAPASSTGVVSSFTGCGGTLKVFNGATDVTTSCAFSILSNPDGLTASIGAATGVYAVTAAGAWADASRVTFLTLRAVFAGVTVDKVFTLTKAVAGTNGSAGSDGARGTVNVAAATAGTTWSNTEANAALVAAGYGSPQSRDIVTLYNSGSTPKYTESRFYSGGSWIPLTAYIDGNLLVSGTVSADVIDGGTVRASSVDIGPNHEFTVDGTTGAMGAWYPVMSVAEAGNVADPTRPCLLAQNSGIGGGSPALKALTVTDNEAIWGEVKNTNANTNAHGVRGMNSHAGTSGIVGGANGYNFYADGAGSIGDYGTFTGAHDALLPNGAEVDPGDIVVDVQVIAKGNLSNVITEVARSSGANQAAAGVFLDVLGALPDHMTPNALWLQPDVYYAVKDLYQYAIMNGVGEGQINVCGEGGDMAVGDLIASSSTPGKGMRQADDLVRGYTVAKTREAVTFDFPGQVKTIACTYLCG